MTKSSSRRSGYQSAMEVFQGVEYVQLQSPVHGTYVHTAEDGCSVRLDARRASHNAVWAVQRRHSTDSDTGYILFRGAYGRYLGAPDTLSSCSFPCPRVAAAQRDFDKPEIKAIMWRAVLTSTSGSAVLLESASGRFLRTGVCLSTCPSSFTASQWIVHSVPWSLFGRPKPPLLPDPQSKWAELLASVRAPLSCVYQRQCSLEREIQWGLADRSGAISEEGWGSFQFTGRETSQLEKKLKEKLKLPIILFIRAGRHGQPTPFCINLPRSRETLYIAVFWGTAGIDRLVFPDVSVLT